MSSQFIILREAAQIAQCHPTTVLRAIQRGELMARQAESPLNHSYWEVDRESLDRWITTRKPRKAKEVKAEK